MNRRIGVGGEGKRRAYIIYGRRLFTHVSEYRVYTLLATPWYSPTQSVRVESWLLILHLRITPHFNNIFTLPLSCAIFPASTPSSFLFTFSTHVVLCVSGRVCVHGCTRCSDLQYVLVITAAKWFSCDLLTSSVRLISLNSFSVKKQKGIPYELQRLQQNGRDLRDTELPFAGFALGNTYHRAEPLTMLLRLCGGKGGFGSMLRAMGSQKSG